MSSLVDQNRGGGQSNIDLWGAETETVVCRLPLITNSAEMSDVKFIFNNEDDGEKIIHGHKLILALASPVFHELFYSKDPGFQTDLNKNEIKMEGHLLALGPQAFEQFMKFVYMGKFQTEEFEGLSIEIIIAILSYANYYDVPYVKKECINCLWEILPDENVFLILESALLFREEFLANYALEFIEENFGRRFISKGILGVKAATLCEIFKRDTLNIDEEYVLASVIRWAENKCKIEKLEASMENIRKVLGPAFFEIRIALLPSVRISQLVEAGLLTHEETVEMFLQQRESGMVLAPDKRIARDVVFKSNVRFRRHDMGPIEEDPLARALREPLDLNFDE